MTFADIVVNDTRSNYVHYCCRCIVLMFSESLGYLRDRDESLHQHIANNESNCFVSRLGRTHGAPGAVPTAFGGSEFDERKSAGISLSGRYTMSLWRVLRKELTLKVGLSVIIVIASQFPTIANSCVC